MTTAAEKGLANCHICGKLSRGTLEKCPRCNETLHVRKPQSLQRTMALLITSCVLYIPANVLPITVTFQFGNDLKSTIIGGVILLWEHGSYPVALVIFIASVMVPSAKIIALFWLVWSVSIRRVQRLQERTIMYRVTEFIGRWSMIDVFVVTILVALVQLGGILSFEPGGAALAFAGVVIFTMFAAMSFDPRLIWDATSYQKE